ncbi:MAG TPA: membrane-associated protein [Hymenobacter sp.]|uniref:membrane-associated protein n=1 Tax=Hymenobacter sp. TaxID=1898978 RepID=UPI002D80F8D8|nr:membrane-associated protein [Hymenobacter sp.]HET9502207.1 membrane-associated protein [Hymenobacter sp.]
MLVVSSRLPLLLKLSVTAFVAVLVPVYYYYYGPTNFLYFCDVALLLCVVSVWTEQPLFASMAAVGILLPQALWCFDFVGELVGVRLVGLTAYMFDPNRSLFLRGLSFFHGWLPFLLLFLLRRLGYDRRALLAWTALGWGLCLVAYFFLPPAGTVLPDPKIPVNINYVFGFDDAKPQSWLPAPVYLLGWMLTLFVVFYLPTHLLLRRWFGRPATLSSPSVGEAYQNAPGFAMPTATQLGVVD